MAMTSINIKDHAASLRRLARELDAEFQHLAMQDKPWGAMPDTSTERLARSLYGYASQRVANLLDEALADVKPNQVHSVFAQLQEKYARLDDGGGWNCNDIDNIFNPTILGSNANALRWYTKKEAQAALAADVDRLNRGQTLNIEVWAARLIYNRIVSVVCSLDDDKLCCVDERGISECFISSLLMWCDRKYLETSPDSVEALDDWIASKLGIVGWVR